MAIRKTVSVSYESKCKNTVNHLGNICKMLKTDKCNKYSLNGIYYLHCIYCLLSLPG